MLECWCFNCKIIHCNIVHFIGYSFISCRLMHGNEYQKTNIAVMCTVFIGIILPVVELLKL